MKPDLRRRRATYRLPFPNHLIRSHVHLFALLCLIILLSPLEAPAQDKLLFALAYGKIYLADISDDGMNIQNIRYLTKGYHPSWSPDGRRISFDEFSQSGNIYVMNLDDKTPHLLIRGGAETDWSPDGESFSPQNPAGYV